MEPVHILLLEDSADDAELIVERLEDAGLAVDVERVADRGGFEHALAHADWDLVLADYLLPHFDGIAALEMVRESYPGLPVILVSGELSEATAIELLKLGATDYVIKTRLDRLAPVIFRCVRELQERRALLRDLQSNVDTVATELDARAAAGQSRLELPDVRRIVSELAHGVEVALAGYGSRA